MNKGRILYITPAGERGGAETVLLTVLRHLDRTRFEPTVVCLQDGPFVSEMREQANVRVEMVPAGRFRDLGRARQAIRQIRQIIRRHHVQLVHCNGIGGHLYGSPAARLCGVPSIFHLHDVLDWSWTRQGMVNLLARLTPATATIAVSNCVARQVQGWPSSSQLHVIHNGVELPIHRIHNAVVDDGRENPQSNSTPCVDRNPQLERWGWPSECLLVVWCGRLQRIKGTDVFLKAVAQVKAQVPQARFLVVGGTLFGLERAYADELQALTRTLNLNGCLRFTGHRPDARRLLAAANLVVNSSVNPEAFPIVVLEAMALGKPVIASAQGGSTESIQPEVTGLLVPPGDPAALAQAMIRLLRDRELRTTMGQAARERVEKCFTVSHMMQKIERLYENVMRDA